MVRLTGGWGERRFVKMLASIPKLQARLKCWTFKMSLGEAVVDMEADMDKVANAVTVRQPERGGGGCGCPVCAEMCGNRVFGRVGLSSCSWLLFWPMGTT